MVLREPNKCFIVHREFEGTGVRRWRGRGEGRTVSHEACAIRPCIAVLRGSLHRTAVEGDAIAATDFGVVHKGRIPHVDLVRSAKIEGISERAPALASAGAIERAVF